MKAARQSIAPIAVRTLARLSAPSIQAAAKTLLATSFSRVAMLAMAIIIARRIGTEGYGVFVFATGLASLLGQLGSFGWPLLVTRLIPTYLEKRDWGRLRGLDFASDRIVFGSMLILALALASFGLVGMDRDDPLRTGMLLAALLCVPSGMRLLSRERLSAIGRAPAGIFYDESVAPLVVLVGCLVFLLSTRDEILVLYAAGTYASAVLARVLYRRWTARQQREATRIVEMGAWNAIALPMLAGVVARVMLIRIDVLLLAPLASAAEVGLFGAAFRIAFMIQLVPGMINPVVRPLLARENGASNHPKVARIMLSFYLFVVSVSVLLSGAAFFFSQEILVALFGSEFAAASTTLKVLAVGTLFASIAEASSCYLLMCGKERIFGVLSFAGLAVAVAMGVVLIPQYGAVGAATAAAVVNAVFAVATGWVVWRTMHLRTAGAMDAASRSR